MLRQFALWSLFAVFGLAASATVAHAQPVTIAWDRNPESFVVGYRVYVGLRPSAYSQSIDVGNVTQFTFSRGVPGQRYYFAVAAYAAGEQRGPLSEEVSTVVGVGGVTGGAGDTSSAGDTSGVGGSDGDTGGAGGTTGVGGSDGDTGGAGGTADGPAVVLDPAVVNGNMVTLSWRQMGRLDAAEYLLEAGSATGASNLYNASVGPATALSAMVGEGVYFVRVRGRARTGDTTPPSNEITVAVGAAGSIGTACTTAPTAPTALSGDVLGSTASARWVAATGATSYIVQAGSAPGRSDLYHGNVGNVTGASALVSPGFSAYVRVVAVNACGQSAASPEIFVR